MPQFLKTLDDDAVLDAANHLLDTAGSTTTLDVKNELRSRGYLADQQPVSEAMTRLARQEGWDTTSNGTYLTYRRMSPSQADGPGLLYNSTTHPGSTLGVFGLLMNDDEED